MALVIRAVGRSEVGLVRSNNEDSGFVGSACILVADGVGGAAAGEVASATTAYVVSASAALWAGRKPADRLLTEAVSLAQQQVRRGVEADAARTGMATTLTAMLTDGDEVWLAHVGDSRGYHWRAGALTRVTRDDTWVQSMLDEGHLTPEEVRHHPWRSVVLKTVSAEDSHTPRVSPLEAAVDDRILVASDGLTDLVADDELERVLTDHPDDDEALEAMVALALERGGHDNVTVVLGRLVEGSPAPGEGRLLGAATDPFLVIDPAAVRSSA